MLPLRGCGAGLVGLLWGAAAATSAAQTEGEAEGAVLIYRVDYARIGESVNYPAPRFGYFFVNPESGAVSSLTVLIDPFTRNLYYTSGLLSGQFFQVRRVLGGATNDVIVASSGSQSGERAALQVTGMTNKRFSVGGGLRFRLSSKLRGVLLLSSSEQPAEADPLTQEEIAAQFGFVGFAEATARYQRTATRLFNNRGEGVSGAVEFYQKMLEDMNIQPEPAPSPSPGPSPQPSPSPQGEGASPAP